MSDEATGNPELGTDEVSQVTETNAEAGDDELLDSLDTEANPEDEEAPKDDIPQPRKLKVKIDGQELEVDEEEAARGYQRQQDYSRHMQRVQAEMQQAQAIKAQYSQQLDQFIPESVARIQRLQQIAEQHRQNGNLAELVEVQYDLNQEVLRYQQANAERSRVRAEQETVVQHNRQQALEYAQKAVIEAIPEWKNPQIKQAEVTEVAKILSDFVGKHYGDYAPQIMAEIDNGMYGPMPVILARKAMLYDKLMAKVAARKAGKSEETSAPAPVAQVRSSGGASKDPSKMTDAEFANWRKKQIAQRN